MIGFFLSFMFLFDFRFTKVFIDWEWIFYIIIFLSWSS